MENLIFVQGSGISPVAHTTELEAEIFRFLSFSLFKRFSMFVRDCTWFCGGRTFKERNIYICLYVCVCTSRQIFAVLKQISLLEITIKEDDYLRFKESLPIGTFETLSEKIKRVLEIFDGDTKIFCYFESYAH